MYDFHAAFPSFNFVGVVLLLLPAYWHVKSRNVNTLLFVFWEFVSVGMCAINSLVFYHSPDTNNPIWCDISTTLRMGANIGIPASIVCITRQLEAIAAARHVHFTPQDRRRSRIIDLSLGLGFPVFTMATHIVYQGHRFDVVQRLGCYPPVYWCWPAIFMYEIWPVIFGLVAAGYAIGAARLFIVRRYQFMKLLESSQSALTTSRFLRLIALALTQVAFSFPVVLYIFVNQCRTKPAPYVSWSSIHYDFGYINEYTAQLWSEYLTAIGTTQAQVTELTYWTPGVGAFLFFIFFGLGEESISGYRACWDKVSWLFGCRRQRVARSSRFGHSSTQLDTSTKISLPPASTGVDHLSELSPDHPSDKLQPATAYEGVKVTIEKDDSFCV